jgi:hypothetical protein
VSNLEQELVELKQHLYHLNQVKKQNHQSSLRKVGQKGDLKYLGWNKYIGGMEFVWGRIRF